MYSDVTLEQALRSVGDGWHDLIRSLYAAMPADVYVVQVKEKWGGLRFYWEVRQDPRNPKHAVRPAIREFEELVSRAEHQSFETCERCGAPGSPTETSWIRTLCAACRLEYVR